MDSERFYAMVADELRTAGPITGLWAKAFADSEGNESKAKALYLRYRAEQLATVESSAILARQEAREAEHVAELQREEAERRDRVKVEGFMPIHGVLIGLAILILILFVFRALGA
jgi:hypothetical protein